MDNVGYAALQIVPSFKGLDANLERGTSGALIAAGTSGGRKYGDSAGRSMAHAFASHARAAALLAGAGLAAAGALVFKLGKDSLAEAEDAARVGAVTRNVIETTGKAAHVSAKQVADLAEALSNKTGVDDEVIQRGANMLLTFTNVRNEVGKGNQVFTEATGIVEDMAAAMAGGTGGANLDLKSSAILVGKALNDPEKGLTALTRVGVAFTDQQKEKIKSLVEEGKTMDAQKLILGELTKEFGGTAEAQATLGDKVKTAWGNIEEKLGKTLLPLLHDAERAFLKKGVPAIEGWVDAFQKKGIPAIHDFYDEAKPVVKDILPKLGDALGTVKDVLADAAPLAKDLIDAFNDMPEWAKKAVVGGTLAAGVGSKLGLGALLTGGKGGGGGLTGLFSKATPLPVLVVNEGFGGGGPGGVLGGRGGKPSAVGGAIEKGSLGLGLLPEVIAGVLAGVGIVKLNEKLAPDSPIKGSPPGSVGGGGGFTAPEGAFDFSDENVFLPSFAKAFAGVEAEVGAAVGQMSAIFNTLPKKVITDFKTNGIPDSKKEAKDLVDKYDLTPKQKATLFKALGIDKAQSDTKALQFVLGKTPEHKNTQFTSSGEQSVIASANAIIDAINRIPLVPNIDFSGAGRRKSGGGGGGTDDNNPTGPGLAGGGGTRTPRPAPTQRDGLYRDLAQFMDDRIAGNNGLKG